jgi:hypothetical protein
MVAYGRRTASDNGSDSPQFRAQRAVDKLVSEMSHHNFTAEEMTNYRDSASVPNAMMEIIAEHCELKLKALSRKRKKRAKRITSGRTCRRSTRVMERDRRKRGLTRIE